MSIIKIRKLNESFLYVTSDFGIEQEMYEYFSFFADGYKYQPRFRNKQWDGKIRLYSATTKQIQVGLLTYILKFAKLNEYQVEFVNEIKPVINVTFDEVKDFVLNLNLHSKGNPIVPRDYQLNAIYEAIKHQRIVLLSPTSCLDPNTIIDVELNDIPKRISLLELDELIKSNQYPKINTPTGMELITDTYRKYGEGVEIQFDDNSTIRSAENHLIWFNDKWTDAVNLSVGDIINSKTITSIKPTSHQEWIDFSVDADHESYFYNGLLHHNSGKSAIIYSIIRWFIAKQMKCLIVVPSTLLVEQMYSDFIDYSSHNNFDIESECNKIYSGFEKSFHSNCAISTWQSLFNMNASAFVDVDVMIGDECHLYQAASVTKMINNMPNVAVRIGTTGTLDGKHISELQLTGLFGKVHKVTTTKALMDDNSVTQLDISCLLLDYDSDTKKLFKKVEYQKELDWIVTNDKRNKFIANLALSQTETTLILFQFVEKHGAKLYDILKDKCHDRELYYISGEVDNAERERIRQVLNSSIGKYKIHFNDLHIVVDESEDILLSDGSTIKCNQLTEIHDIDNNWIKTKKLFKT